MGTAKRLRVPTTPPCTLRPPASTAVPSSPLCVSRTMHCGAPLGPPAVRLRQQRLRRARAAGNLCQQRVARARASAAFDIASSRPEINSITTSMRPSLQSASQIVSQSGRQAVDRSVSQSAGQSFSQPARLEQHRHIGMPSQPCPLLDQQHHWLERELSKIERRNSPVQLSKASYSSSTLTASDGRPSEACGTAASTSSQTAEAHCSSQPASDLLVGSPSNA